MNNFRKLNNIFGWFTFLIATAVYMLTLEPTASWWDCGEYISTAFKLQVGHPPGAPLFQIIGRFFSLFAFGDVSQVAFMVNMMSGLSSSFTILFLFWTIVLLGKKVIPDWNSSTKGMYTLFAAAFIGSMTYTFSDTFWFSAVEGEVYAMSSFFTAISFWAIMKWEEVADQKHSYRWLVFIAFLMGLAIGVHLLNLLVIPATCMVYYHKKVKEPTRIGMLLTFILSIIILAFIMFIIIPWTVELSGKFELLFVNGFGLPFNTGTTIYFLLLIGLIVFGLYYTRKTGRVVMNTILLGFTFILIGYSSFLMLVIRANANPPINENAPKDAVSLLSYLNREQYGDFPIFHGQYYSAPIVDYADGKPVYQKDKASGKYIVIDDRKGSLPVWDKRFTTLFPRMWSNQRKGSEDFYKKWGGPGVPIEVTNSEGKTETRFKPTFGENLKYFFTYQIGHMYLRYFMWNFVGRQNDVQGFGGIEEGNWISGIPFIDKARLGHDQVDLPDSKQNRASNKYYFLPFILGLIGLFFHIQKDYRGAVIISLLFIMTGLAILVYLNQQPYEPRERDYAYAASFYAFAVWVGLGIIPLINALGKKLKGILPVALVFAVSLALVPGIMAVENWDDHDRSGKYACRDFAGNYMKSCDPQGILFTNGDNDTFPLWYSQEVEGVGTDVRVVNLMLASGPWYINQLYQQAYESKPVPLSLSQEQYRQGTNDIIPFYDMKIQGYTELKDLIEFIKSDNPQTYLSLQNGGKMKFFPTRRVKITVDSAACVRNGIVPPHLNGKMVDSIYWTIKSNHLYKNDLMLLDLLANNKWERPLYFAAPSSVGHCVAIDSFCHVTGWVYKFMPVKADSANYIRSMGGVDAMTSYEIFKNKFAWGNLSDPHVYVDPESLNNAVRPKTNMMRTAQMLVGLGKKQEAIEMLDLYIKNFPDSKVPFDMYMLPYVEIYYNAGATDKGNALSSRLIEIFDQNLKYYGSFSPEYNQYFSEDVQMNLAMVNRIAEIAKVAKQDAVAVKAKKVFDDQLKLFNP